MFLINCKIGNNNSSLLLNTFIIQSFVIKYYQLFETGEINIQKTEFCIMLVQSIKADYSAAERPECCLYLWPFCFFS